MTRTFASCALAALVALGLAGTAAGQEPMRQGEWPTDFVAAKAAAKEQQRPILAFFTGSDWCPPCKKLRAEVFATAAFREWADKKVVLLEIDQPKQKVLPKELQQQNEELVRHYGVRSFPTVLVFDHDGKVTGQVDYQPGPVGDWLARAEVEIAPRTQPWHDDPDAAFAVAREQKRIVLLFFHSEASPFSARLEREVFARGRFDRWAAEHAVLVRLDLTPREPEREETRPEALRERIEALRIEHRVRTFPTVVFVDAEGKPRTVLGYVEGGPEAWLQRAERELRLPKRKS
jgi:thioredoxin-related protein